MNFGKYFCALKRITTSNFYRFIHINNYIRCSKFNSQSYLNHRVRFHSTTAPTPCFLEALNHLDRPAIKDNTGLHTYKELLIKSAKVSKEISKFAGRDKFVSILCPHSSSYVVCLWAGWLSGCVVVPLSTKHPPTMLDYFLSDSRSKVLLSSTDHHLTNQLKQSNKHIKVLQLEDILDSENTKDTNTDDITQMESSYWLEAKERSQSESWKKSSALVVYTSGTTGKPKGVLHSHGSLGRMVGGMMEEWKWMKEDVIIHSLPLHHIHGIVNILLTPLMTGALCVMCDFKADLIWRLLLGSADENDLPRRVNVMMGVPTMYSMLLEEVLKNGGSGGCGSGGGVGGGGDGSRGSYLEYVKENCSTNIRLFVSGSAPLQLSIMKKWEELTGHVLLERYGMTEIGMALGNPLAGPRIPGAVGNPFPLVEVAIAKNSSQSEERTDLLVRGDTKGTVVIDDTEQEGELLIKGGTLLHSYLNNPQATTETFTKDGWFKTGDTATYDRYNHTYRILGRTSVDVIKSGGYKLSAIQIENTLLEHPLIGEVAVVGMEDKKWGQVVAALVVLQNAGGGGSGGSGGGSSGGGEDELTLKALRKWCVERMPAYQRPSLLRTIPSLQRNALGKINKKELIKTYFK